MFCKKCGSLIQEGSLYCTNCGELISNKAVEKSNSKKKFIILFMVEVIIFLSLFIGVFVENKNYVENNFMIETYTITANDFRLELESYDYVVSDVTSNYLWLENLENYYIADNNNYEISFIEFSNLDSTKLMYNNICNRIEESVNSHSSFKNVNYDNYRLYSLIANNKYYIVIMNGNTILFSEASDEYEEEIYEVIEQLGYGTSFDFDIEFPICFYLLFGFMFVLALAIWWKIFEKANKKGWYFLIPGYNFYCMFDIAFGNGWYCLLMFIPIVNFVFVFMLYYKLAKVFGKSDGFAICNIFFMWITMQIIAFDDSKYIK